MILYVYNSLDSPSAILLPYSFLNFTLILIDLIRLNPSVSHPEPKPAHETQSKRY